jgi:hypothetical protein
MTHLTLSSRTSEASVGIYFHSAVIGVEPCDLDPDTRAPRSCGMTS